MPVILFGETARLHLVAPFSQSGSNESTSQATGTPDTRRIEPLGIDLIKVLLSRSNISGSDAFAAPSQSQIVNARDLNTADFSSEVTSNRRLSNTVDRMAPSSSVFGGMTQVALEGGDYLTDFSDHSPSAKGDILAIFLPGRPFPNHRHPDYEREIKAQVLEYLSDEDRKAAVKWVAVYSDFETVQNIFTPELEKHLPETAKKVAVCDIEDFRKSAELKISKGYSWEKTVAEFEEHVVDPNNFNRCKQKVKKGWDFKHAEKLNQVRYPSDNALILFTCDLDGIIICNTNNDRPSIIFDPRSAEGEFRNKYPERFVDEPEVVFASVLASLLSNRSGTTDQTPICDIGATALNAVRKHLIHGYIGKNGKPGGIDTHKVFETNFFLDRQFARLELPVDRDLKNWLKFLSSDTHSDHETYRDDYIHKLTRWRAQEFLYSFLEMEGAGDAMGIAQRIIKTGRPPDTLPAKGGSGSFTGAVCSATFGKFKSIDRKEIESFRATKQIIAKYLRDQDPERPLSLAVFGPPGCGKSFGVKQICAELREEFRGTIAEHTIDINLSMLENSTQLVAAFHGIRNTVISGKVPVVFFDEFDSANEGHDYFWLKYFLAPMQDGEFRDGETNHKIGKSIFIFAGGTTERFKDFEVLGQDPEKRNIITNGGNTAEHEKPDGDELSKQVKAYRYAKNAKLPDFASRIANFIDIAGPNQNEHKGEPEDHMYQVRRAELLKEFVLSKTGRRGKAASGVEISAAVQDAFLTCVFKHGARSMQTIVNESEIPPGERFTLSCLPPRSVLSIHVENVDAFLQR